jgi:hypothetical protein
MVLLKSSSSRHFKVTAGHDVLDTEGEHPSFQVGTSLLGGRLSHVFTKPVLLYLSVLGGNDTLLGVLGLTSTAEQVALAGLDLPVVSEGVDVIVHVSSIASQQLSIPGSHQARDGTKLFLVSSKNSYIDPVFHGGDGDVGMLTNRDVVDMFFLVDLFVLDGISSEGGNTTFVCQTSFYTVQGIVTPSRRK